MFGFDIPADGYDAGEIDTFQKTGGLMPAGRYHVRLDGHRTDATKSKGTPYDELTFKVVSGPFAGADITENLYQSEKEGAKKRVILFAAKLGLLERKGAKLVPVDGKETFGDAMGAECVLEIEHEKWESEDGKKSGTKPRVTFAGIYRTTDPEARGVVGKGGAVPTGGRPADKPKPAAVAL